MSHLVAAATSVLALALTNFAHGQDLSGLTRSTASIYENERYRCRSNIIQTQPRVEIIMQCEVYRGYEYEKAFDIFCILDKQGYQAFKKANPSDNKQRMLYTCPVRMPIPFRNGEGVDLNCEFLGEEYIRSWRRSQALSGRRDREPESWCTAKKFEIDWEAQYEEWKTD